MSQEPSDPTASPAPSDGTPPTIPAPAADVQPDAGGTVPPAEPEDPAAAAEEPPPAADVQPDAGGSTPPPAAAEETAAAAEEPPSLAGPPSAPGETSAAILAAVVAEPQPDAQPPAEPATEALPEPAPESAPQPAMEPVLVEAFAPDGPRRRGPWRTIGGVLLLMLLAAAVGFGASFLVPGFVDVGAPSGAAAATTPGPSATPAPRVSPSPSLRPSQSPTPSPSSGGSATPRSSSTIYIVQKGDILSAIAARFGVTVQAIVAANGLTDPNHIEPGQRLIIPPP